MPFSIRPFRRLALAYFSSGFWLLVTLLILLCSGPAYAEWVPVAKGFCRKQELETNRNASTNQVRRRGHRTFGQAYAPCPPGFSFAPS